MLIPAGSGFTPDTDETLKSLGCEFTKRADGMYVVEGNVSLSSKKLVALPDLSSVIVNGHFFCSDNKLASLVGAPKLVSGNFSCGGNQLTSLTGAPIFVGETFYCSYNQLASLNDMPRQFGKMISDFGEFTSAAKVPEELCASPEAKAALLHQAFLEATDCSKGLRKHLHLLKPLKFK